MKTVKKSYFLTLFALAIALALTQCAKRGSPTGGPVDEEPPAILRAFPDNYSVNFKNQKIEVVFDEYIKLKDLQKQLVISPPLKYRPDIRPQGDTSKKLTIEILDTLQDNTTYVLNFGQSIVDNTEGNAYPFFKYIFSTGSYIDSLQIKGRVTDALNFETDDFVNVMLYEVDETYTDSIIYKEQPRYVVNTLDSLTTFTMENLKAGTYRMVALKESSSNLKFDPKSDKIGFVSEVITVPTDENFEVTLYKPIQDREIRRATQVAKSRIQIGYTGELDSMSVSPVYKSLITASRITKEDKKDTLNYWYQPILERDSLKLEVEFKDFKQSVTARLKEQEADSLIVSKYGQFSLRTPIEFTATTPIASLSPLQMTLMNKDSVSQDFAIKFDSLKNVMTVEFDAQPDNRYNFRMLPGAITDFYGATIDTMTSIYTTRAASDLGNIPINFSGGSNFPIIVEIVTESLEVVATQTIRQNSSIAFDYLTPNKYYIRMIYDANDNGRYDPGNFLENRQPEKVVYFPDLIALQANWDYVTNITLE